jgi:DNA topoisomerase-1
VDCRQGAYRYAAPLWTAKWKFAPVPVECWTLHAILSAGEPPVFEAKLSKYKGEEIEVHTQAEADAIIAAASSADWKVASVTQKEKRRFAPPPLLRQSSSRRPTTAFGIPPSALCRWRNVCMRASSWGRRLGRANHHAHDSVRVSNDA